MTSPHSTPGVNAAQALAEVGATVLQRDWLSSNHIVFAGHAGGEGAAVVDTGFDSHAPLTLQLLAHALKGERLGRVLNTHLHSDHCGGNAWLQEAHRCATFVPEPSFEAVRQWDEEALTYRELDQRCRRFHTDAALVPGQALRLGDAAWQIVAAPGHDPEAVMLFQPEARVLIAGDALWEHNVAILFPELEGGEGFGPALQTLAHIEALNPGVVVPGHGAPFTDVAAALHRSRTRLHAFQAEPARHLRYAQRGLAVFHLLEVRRMPRAALLAWMRDTPLFRRLPAGAPDAEEVLEGLLKDGHLKLQALTQEICVP